MAITVGSYVFDAGTTSVKESYEAVGGKEMRVIVFTGLLRGASDQAGLEAELDEIMAAASEESPVYVSVRAGRRMRVRRAGFSRESNQRGLTGHFVLTLEAEDAYEESEIVKQVFWSIALSGATVTVVNGGNVVACPVVTLEALGTIIAPQVSDGTRSLAYDGVIEAGSTLILDGEEAKAWLDGVDITPYTTGDFPRLVPGSTVLTYTDDPTSSHSIDGEVAFRDRWW